MYAQWFGCHALRRESLRRPLVFTWVVILILLLAGCNTLALQKSISMELIYHDNNQTDVTIHYTVPFPPPGKVYVLWVVNPRQRDSVNAGQVSGGRNQTARATVDFQATGVIVSIEDTPNPSKMSNTWALKVGTVTLETPTPEIGVPTRQATSTVEGTPNAANTPNAEFTPSAFDTPSADLTPGAATTPDAGSTPNADGTPSAAETPAAPAGP